VDISKKSETKTTSVADNINIVDYGVTYYSFDELKDAIKKYILYYNEKRIKEKLGWMSPVEYRLSTLAA